jgi:ATP-dependent 26S proteasome regulatory subunit
MEASHTYSGKAGGVKVHKLRSVQRSDIILPEKTLGLLERNVNDFIRQRERLKTLGLATKKGLLFYGPPGTGRTHTIHFLAGPAWIAPTWTPLSKRCSLAAEA